MKNRKLVYALLATLCFCLVLCACNRSVSHDGTTSVGDTESQAAFYDLVKDNPIDAAYRADSCGDTVAEMVEFEKRYTELWQEELALSCGHLSNLLSNEDKTQLDTIQQDWEDNISQTHLLVLDILMGEDYGVHMGSTFLYEQALEYRKAVRDRALYIKYLQFCIEANGPADTEPTVLFWCENIR